jgi:predicted ThiF/HesA family dinucleotide-utilizing enzyme
MSADIYTGGMIGAKTIGRSGVWGVGDKGVTVPQAIATGGTITVDGDYIVHTFTASDAFTPLFPPLRS